MKSTGFRVTSVQHVGGFIITQGRLDELVPVENASMDERTVICWDKDDIDTLGILKVDVLSLGMLTCIRKAFDLMQMHHRRAVLAGNAAARGFQKFMTCCAAPTASGCFRWKAARK